MNASRTSSSFSHRLSTFEAHRRSPSPFVLHSRSAQMQFLLRTSTQHRQGKLSLQSSFTFQTQPIPFFEHLSLLSRCDLSILKATRFMSFPFEGTNLRRFSPWVAPPGLPLERTPSLSERKSSGVRHLSSRHFRDFGYRFVVCGAHPSMLRLIIYQGRTGYDGVGEFSKLILLNM